MNSRDLPSEPSTDVDRIAAAALAEDGEVDVTTDLVGASLRARGTVVFRSVGVVAGTPYAEAVALQAGCDRAQWCVAEGTEIEAGGVVGLIEGSAAQLLRAERPLLNVLQRACGIATLTRAFVEAVTDTTCQILHTRKTAPGLRALDVAAVLAGGGMRHRMNLGDQVMVKDNHWALLAAGDLALGEVLERARSGGITALYVEVESPEQVEAACRAGATRLLIDNQTPDVFRQLAALARRLASDIEIEATGSIAIENVGAFAVAGADYASVGALTHSVAAADISLDISQR